MKKIRQSVWETNSSSSHSISIGNDNQDMVLDTIYPDENGTIYVNGGDFGWEWNKYNDAKTKLSYAYQDGVDVWLLEEVIKEHTGAKTVIFGDINNGYIDHQSSGVARTMCDTARNLKNFIFNKNSWLFTGNDNSIKPPNFDDVPTYIVSEIIYPNFKYEIKIDRIDETIKFRYYPTQKMIYDSVKTLTGSKVLTKKGIIDDVYFYDNDHFKLSPYIIQNLSLNYIIMVNPTLIREITGNIRKNNEGVLSYNEISEMATNIILENEQNYLKLNFSINEI